MNIYMVVSLMYTDNNPFTYILTSVQLDVTGQRWVASLANHNFHIFYKLPRLDHTMLDDPTVKAMMNVVSYTDWSDYNLHPTDIVCKSTQVVVHKKSRDEWKTEQENDPIIGPVIQAIKTKQLDTSELSVESKRLLQGCYSDVVYYTEKFLMASFKKTNSSLFYQNPIGNNH